MTAQRPQSRNQTQPGNRVGGDPRRQGETGAYRWNRVTPNSNVKEKRR
jgi:hypothetical protein